MANRIVSAVVLTKWIVHWRRRRYGESYSERCCSDEMDCTYLLLQA